MTEVKRVIYRDKRGEERGGVFIKVKKGYIQVAVRSDAIQELDVIKEEDYK